MSQKYSALSGSSFCGVTPPRFLLDFGFLFRGMAAGWLVQQRGVARKTEEIAGAPDKGGLVLLLLLAWMVCRDECWLVVYGLRVWLCSEEVSVAIDQGGRWRKK